MLDHRTSDEVIAEYQAAFTTRHHRAAPRITYARGWFTFKDGSNAKCRRHALDQMKDFLLEQARQMEAMV